MFYMFNIFGDICRVMAFENDEDAACYMGVDTNEVYRYEVKEKTAIKRAGVDARWTLCHVTSKFDDKDMIPVFSAPVKGYEK